MEKASLPLVIIAILISYYKIRTDAISKGKGAYPVERLQRPPLISATSLYAPLYRVGKRKIIGREEVDGRMKRHDY